MLLAFGRAVDIDNQSSGARTIPIAAIAGGEAGEAVKIIKIRDERAGWGGHKGVKLEMPGIGGEDEGWWAGDGAPVRQICFGDGETGKTSWLAIRLSTSTVVLHPQYRRLPTVTGAIDSSKRQYLSRIDPNYLFTIPVSRTGMSHSDVTFNPWYNRQCAIIDQSGQWSVWDLDGQKKKRNTYSAKDKQRGYVFNKPAGRHLGDDTAGEDGWGRVCWVGDANTLVACSRRHLAVIDLKTDPPTRLDVPDLDLTRTPNWILDMKRSPISNSHFFVLTTSQIFLLEIVGNNPGTGSDSRRARARILLSWRHFRDVDDSSLQVEVLGLDYVEHLLLYSRFNKLVTAYQFSHVTVPPSAPISISDPYTFMLPQGICTTSGADRPDSDLSTDVSISALILLPLQYVTSSTIPPRGPGQVYIKEGVRFFNLFVLGNDLSVRDCLYTSGIPNHGDQSTGESAERSITVVPPNDRPKPPHWAFRSTRVITEENFIVGDGAEDTSGQSDVMDAPSAAIYGTTDGHTRHIRDGNTSVAQVENGLSDLWTLNFESIYNLVFLQDGKRKTTLPNEGGSPEHDALPQGTEETQLDTYQRALKRRVLAKRSTGFRPIQTLLELYEPPSYFEDIDRASLELRHFLSLIETLKDDEGLDMALTTKALVPIAFNFPFQGSIDQEQQGDIDENSLLELYDRLVDVWVTFLPRTASGKLRLAKERIARKVAAELYLSSIGVALIDSEQERISAPSEQDRTGDLSMEVPIRTREELPRDIGKGKEKQRREPSNSPQPSLNTGLEREARRTSASLSSRSRRPFSTLDSTSSLHSYSSYESRESGAEDASCTRLRAYTSLIPRPPLPPTMTGILAHWKAGSDPSLYSWSDTRVALASSEDHIDPASGGDEAALRRLKREKRLLKRHRSSTVASASSSQPVESGRLWGSQPVTASHGSQGQADGDIVPASQIERGVFGGRPRFTTSKRKKRTAGF
ncbi:hypothetical protein GP486_000777 [Trichoglossum hirsutum]|uniref:RNA polymerase I-specific transcription initiation factor RRN6-like protein n=1 Tax=Trichoglossum hirsutum TaxID=265104 RepID=A0A9P8LI35_9PEZI|nr:hypothetical protein GP486_000777 [Trichoglossum hirsutum]